MRPRRSLATLAGAVALVVAGAIAAAVRVSAAPPLPDVTAHVVPGIAVGGAAPPIALPEHGSLALMASGDHLAGSPLLLVEHDSEHARPIASVAKALTALVVVNSKPLGAGDSGEAYTINARDVAFYRAAVASGGSSAFVSLGERFTERQLLEALLLPSGNNIAMTLAVWTSGSVPAFLATENATALALGMAGTTITDPSGFDARTRSTALDLIKVATAVESSPALAAIVSERSATLPDGSSISNFDTALGTPGWLGVKTGDSDAAGGCLLFAARVLPSGDSDPRDAVTFVGAVLGERSLLAQRTGDDDRAAAIYDAQQAVDTAIKGFIAVNPSAVASAPALTGSVGTAWGAHSGLTLGAPRAVTTVLARSSAAVTLHVTVRARSAPMSAGATVGSVEGSVDGRVVLRWPVRTVNGIAEPGAWWRLLHG